MEHEEKIPLWWKIWLKLTLAILGSLFIILKTFWVAFFGAGAFLFFGAFSFLGQSDSRANNMAGVFSFMLFVIFLIGFIIILTNGGAK